MAVRRSFAEAEASAGSVVGVGPHDKLINADRDRAH